MVPVITVVPVIAVVPVITVVPVVAAAPVVTLAPAPAVAVVALFVAQILGFGGGAHPNQGGWEDGDRLWR